MVGARLEVIGLTPKGAARVYSGFDGSLLYTFEGTNGSDFFGRAVGRAGDVNADGYDDILVGAPGDDDGGNFSGSVRSSPASTARCYRRSTAMAPRPSSAPRSTPWGM